jgi:hypothetical protein
MYPVLLLPVLESPAFGLMNSKTVRPFSVEVLMVQAGLDAFDGVIEKAASEIKKAAINNFEQKVLM